MRGLATRVLLLSLLMANAAGIPAPQETVDRIAARVENDIILLSDIRALSRYQQFLDGKSETEAQILDRLIDQWMVRTEADVSRFPPPSDAEIAMYRGSPTPPTRRLTAAWSVCGSPSRRRSNTRQGENRAG